MIMVGLMKPIVPHWHQPTNLDVDWKSLMSCYRSLQRNEQQLIRFGLWQWMVLLGHTLSSFPIVVILTIYRAQTLGTACNMATKRCPSFPSTESNRKRGFSPEIVQVLFSVSPIHSSIHDIIGVSAFQTRSSTRHFHREKEGNARQV